MARVCHVLFNERATVERYVGGAVAGPIVIAVGTYCGTISPKMITDETWCRFISWN